MEIAAVVFATIWAVSAVLMFWVAQNADGTQEKTFHERNERGKFTGERTTYTYYTFTKENGDAHGVCMEIGWGFVIFAAIPTITCVWFLFNPIT